MLDWVLVQGVSGSLSYKQYSLFILIQSIAVAKVRI